MSFITDTWDKITTKSDEVLDTAKGNASDGISKWFSDTADKIFKKPSVQVQAKKVTANKIGTWIVDNYKLIAGVSAGIFLLAIATRKKW